MKRILSFAILLSLVACSANNSTVKNDIPEYPQNPQEKRRDRAGKLTGDDGIVLFGKGKSSSKDSGSGIGVNSYLWRASIETISFMPLASADPFGGVIITDWYEDSTKKGERFKVNVLITNSELRADAVKVTVFRQALDKSGKWHDSAVNKQTAAELENKILTRARELKVKRNN